MGLSQWPGDWGMSLSLGRAASVSLIVLDFPALGHAILLRFAKLFRNPPSTAICTCESCQSKLHMDLHGETETTEQ